MQNLFKVAVAVSIGTGAAMAGAANAKDYYADKRIEVVLPVPAGGGLDRNARIFLRSFEKHVAGKPTIVVKNMPGGGGQRGINHVFAKGGRKGTMLVWGPFNFSGILAGLPGIRYKPEEFKPLGAMTTPFVTIVRTDLVEGGMKSPKDLMKAKQPFVNGGRIPGGSLGTYGIITYNMLGLKYRHSIGYRNQPKLKAALIQKEIQSLSTGNPGFWVFYANDLIKKGEARAVYYHPPFDLETGKMKDLGDFYGKGVKPFAAFYKEVTGKDPSGPQWDVYKWWGTFQIWSMWLSAPPKTPVAQLKILRAAYLATTKDEEFLTRFKKANKRIPNFVIGEDAEKVAASFRQLSKEGVAELKKILNVGRK